MVREQLSPVACALRQHDASRNVLWRVQRTALKAAQSAWQWWVTGVCCIHMNERDSRPQMLVCQPQICNIDVRFKKEYCTYIEGMKKFLGQEEVAQSCT